MRERSPGVWEIRIAVGVDPVSGRTVQRSFSFHGCAEEAELHRKELAAEWAERRAIRRAAPFLTVGELLERWLSAHHDWRPATWISARSNAKALRADGLAARRVSTLKPEHVRAAMAAWSGAGASVAVVSGRFRVLRSAIGWAHVERIIDVNPLSGMRGPQRPGTRLHLDAEEVLRVLEAADALVAASAGRDAERLHKAEQIRLLVRLAADSGRGVANWWRCVSTTSRGGCSPSSGESRPTCSGLPRPGAPGGSPSAGGRPNCGGRAPSCGRGGYLTAPLSVPGSSPPRPHTTSDSAPAPSGTGSPGSPEPPTSTGPRCTVCVTQWPPSSLGGASCCGPSSDSATGTPQPPCATTPMPCRSKTGR